MATVKPLHGETLEPKAEMKTVVPAKAGTSGSLAQTSRGSRLPGNDERPKPASSGLDSHWDRRIHRGGIVPDISIDLHDSSLSRAYARLDGALEQAVAQQLKVILLVTGKPRAHDRASGEGRGAIAAVVRDWLAASRHSRYISAVRGAHPKHGGAGALYIILKA